MVVHIWIRNSKGGEYLIQKRSSMVDVWPDIWSVAGGSAVKGENSLDAAFREVKEELGLTLNGMHLRDYTEPDSRGVFSDLWLVCMGCKPQGYQDRRKRLVKSDTLGIEEIVSMIKEMNLLISGRL